MTKTAGIQLVEDDNLDSYIDGRIALMFSAKTVGADARIKLRGLIKFYAKKAKPFTSCVNDNRKRFGPRTEAICATLKDIIRGTTRWRNQQDGVMAADDQPGDPPIDDDLHAILLSFSDEDWAKMEILVFAASDGEDPGAILAEQDPDNPPDAERPPEAAAYRPADVQGISCASCAKFQYTGVVEDNNGGMLPVGRCDLWEAKVEGDHVSDGYAESTPPVDENGNDVFEGSGWDFSADREFFFSSGDEVIAEDNLIWKDIFRTGEWAITPFATGEREKPLTIVDMGETDIPKGIISLEQLESAFNEKAVPYVTVPLTDEEYNDHKDIARVNTGFVKKLRRIKRGDKTILQAGIHFTDEDAKQKVKEGTYADVSVGVLPFRHKRTGKRYPAVLKHVAITNSPWIDGMNPFGITASDDEAPKPEDIEVESYVPAEDVEAWNTKLSFNWRRDRINETLHETYDNDHNVIDIAGSTVQVKAGDETWTASFTIVGDGVELPPKAEWVVKAEGDEQPGESDTPPSPSEQEEAAPLTALEAAQRERRIMASLSRSAINHGGSSMPLTEEELSGLEMSDDARAAVREALREGASDRATARRAGVDARITELEEMGFSNAPGFLTLYRRVSLADDGGPAVALTFADDGTTQLAQPEEIGARDLLDQVIAALPTEDGKIVFSAQLAPSGHDVKPEDDDKDKDDYDNSPEAVKKRTSEQAEAMGDSAYARAQ